jgi:hypothetical protein
MRGRAAGRRSAVNLSLDPHQHRLTIKEDDALEERGKLYRRGSAIPLRIDASSAIMCGRPGFYGTFLVAVFSDR